MSALGRTSRSICPDDSWHSIELQADRLDDRRPFRDLAIEEVARLLRIRVDVGLEARCDEELLHLVVGHGVARGLRDAFDDRARRAGSIMAGPVPGCCTSRRPSARPHGGGR